MQVKADALKPEEADQVRSRKTKQFKSKIKEVFTKSGFEYIDSENQHMTIGPRVVEIDSIFFYENIMILCEDTDTGEKHSTEHIRNKHEAFTFISENKADFFTAVIAFSGKEELQNNYQTDRYKLYFLYFSQQELELEADDYKRFSLIKFVKPKELEYLYRMSQYLERSAKYEIFRYLEITDKDIGIPTTEEEDKRIRAAIISPKEATGLYNGVRVVSFMMRAETLIKNSYVLRKDNWESSISLYQRLIQKEKIKKIRKFLVEKGEAFYNNIIVALPRDVYFADRSGNKKSVKDIEDFDSYTMLIPDCMNSICIIDGQHRVYAHYESSQMDEEEKKISVLRSKLHLLVTGLVFPPEMSDAEMMKIQSEIFLEINSNVTPVPPDVILSIEQQKDPLSDVGLARAVIEELNKESVLSQKFEMSLLDKGKIKIASIVKFALRYLVALDPKDKKNLYSYWDGDKDALHKKEDEALEAYVKFCAHKLNEYFSAVKNVFSNEWNDENSKILSVISINGFIIAFTRFLEQKEPQNFKFYKNHLKKLSIDFSKEKFPYTSSQYRKFSDKILGDGLLSE